MYIEKYIPSFYDISYCYYNILIKSMYNEAARHVRQITSWKNKRRIDLRSRIEFESLINSMSKMRERFDLQSDLSPFSAEKANFYLGEISVNYPMR